MARQVAPYLVVEVFQSPFRHQVALQFPNSVSIASTQVANGRKQYLANFMAI